MKLGVMHHNIKGIEVASEYERLAKDDENAAVILINGNKYRHAVYFLIQAMEKYIRAKIFSLVNPDLEYYREKNRNHSLEDATNFLIEIISSDPIIREQVAHQIQNQIFGQTYWGLNNSLRYPIYSSKYKSYSILEISKKDVDFVLQSLDMLKKYLKDLDRIR